MKSIRYKVVIMLLLMSFTYACSAQLGIREKVITTQEKTKQSKITDRYNMILLDKVLALKEDILQESKQVIELDNKKELTLLDKQLDVAQSYLVSSLNTKSDEKAIKLYNKAIDLIIEQIKIKEQKIDTGFVEEKQKRELGETPIEDITGKELSQEDISSNIIVLSDYFSNGEYEKIIDFIESANTPLEAVPIKIAYLYAISLEHEGREDEAISVLSEVLLGYKPKDREHIEILYDMGKWLLNRQDFEGALRAFNYILEEYRENNQWYVKAREKTELYSVNFQELLAKIKLEEAEKLMELNVPAYKIREILKEVIDSCSFCPSSQRAMELDLDIVNQQAKKIEKIYQRVDELTSANEFASAIGLLETVREKYSIYDDNPNIKYLLSLVPDKITNIQNTEIHFIQEQDERLFSNGKREYENGRYEEALVIFEKCLDTPWADEAELMIKRCIDNIVKNERDKSATLFQKAKDETDIDKKKSLLQESYYILQNVLEKYPQTNYKNKIKANIVLIKDTLSGLN